MKGGMYVCSKVKNSQARTGHQRGMGGRWTDDDDTHERHTDTNRLTRHTASELRTDRPVQANYAILKARLKQKLSGSRPPEW